LYNKGLIYRGNYIINWCPRCQTALSDEEAPHIDVEGKLYYIRYPFSHSAERIAHGKKEHDEGGGVVVATTRPETMLGDAAVAVHPKDRRYKKLIGKKLILPIMGREIDIIADDFVDKKFGTGAVKVTPAHDPNDFDISKRHDLEPVKVMAPDGRMNDNAGRFKGMDRFEAREEIVKELQEKGLLVKTEKHHHAVGHCYRCHTAIEPYLSLQWFVKMKPLAAAAIEAVKKGEIKFYPKRWTKVYLNWMENIRDWCISRQIWWGHRIPVYYCKDCVKTGILKSKIKNQKSNFNAGIIVSKTKPEKCPKCGSYDIHQDEDVLDTWFSSWLWPFSVFGWPEKTKDLEYFYPTSVLVTAPEILFFWVSRMIMSGLEFMKKPPFKDVYLHGTVRDLTGKKMSKSLGNIIDPLEIIDEFGSDALRYSVIAITATGQDVYLSREKFEIGRNFANKIWNASRFVLMNVRPQDEEMSKAKPWTDAVQGLALADRWILSRLNRAIESVTKALENYRFNEAESVVYDFFWHDFCDWYVEMIKPLIADRKETTERVLIHVLESSLKLLHPFMPFVTEAVWQNIRERGSIMKEKWPVPEKSFVKKNIEKNLEIIQTVIVSIRNIRADMNIPHSAMLTVYIAPLKKGGGDKLKEGIEYITRLARVKELTVDNDVKKPVQCATAVLEGFNVFVSLEGVIDVESEKARLGKKMEDLKIQIRHTDDRLKNRDFITRAPDAIVNKEKEKSENLKEQAERLERTLRSL
ncbi:MAG TPA: valine--tRNA ligase, partial [Candidatus Omnitrophica bacterium]|nr:valine--tRNA ligase [Candidatus Omnitrophota bacterium]